MPPIFNISYLYDSLCIIIITLCNNSTSYNYIPSFHLRSFLVRSSIHLRFISIPSSKYLRYASVMPPLR